MASAPVAATAVIADAIRLGGGLSTVWTVSRRTHCLRQIVRGGRAATYYYSQWMGLDPDDWEYFNDVVSRPIFARWNHAGSGEDAVYISWHTNGYTGTTRGTESYVHNGETYSRTVGSLELQERGAQRIDSRH